MRLGYMSHRSRRLGPPLTAFQREESKPYPHEATPTATRLRNSTVATRMSKAYPISSCARAWSSQRRPDPPRIHSRVNERARNAPMAQRRLDQRDVAGVPVEPHRESVTQPVGGRCGPDACLPEPLRHPSLNVACADRLRAPAGEQRPGRALADVAPQVLADLLAEEHDLGTAALHLADPELAAFGIDVLDLKGDSRPDPDSSREQQVEQSVVARGVAGLQRCEQAVAFIVAH